jgi:hypothetical protein
MTMKFCPRDQRNVEPEHSWNTVVLILLILFTGIIGLIYLAIKWKRRCPICHLPDDQLLPPNAAPMGAMPGMAPGMMMGAGAPPAAAGAPTQPCPSCGGTLQWMAQHNRWWCAQENAYK